MVIEVELGAVQTSDLEMTGDAGQLCIRGERDDLGPFDIRFDLPPGYGLDSLASANVSFANGILRIEMPRKKESVRSRPTAMMIYCNGCGKLFDIVVTSKGSRNYRCPACGMVQAFDFGAFLKKAVEQSRKMAGKKRGRR